MTEEQIREIIRKEMLEIFEEAYNRSRQGSGSAGFGTSQVDMAAGRGTATEYLLQVIRERVVRSAPGGIEADKSGS